MPHPPVRIALVALLLLTLAAAVVATGAASSGADQFAADCIHVDGEGVVRPCVDGEETRLSPSAAVLAANWSWWGPAAAPVALAGSAVGLWWLVRGRFRRGRGASPVPRRS